MNQDYFTAAFTGNEPVELPKIPPFIYDGVSGALRDVLTLVAAIEATAEQIQSSRAEYRAALGMEG